MFYLGRQIAPEKSEPTAAPAHYDAADLFTHAFVVGIMECRKMGLGVGLLEEAALETVEIKAEQVEMHVGEFAPLGSSAAGLPTAGSPPCRAEP